MHFGNLLEHIRGAPSSDTFLDVMPLGDVTCLCHAHVVAMKLLQMRIVQTEVCISLDQERQIPQLASEYGVANCKPMKTPMVVHTDHKKFLDPPRAAIPFRQVVGSLLWIARHMHP